MGQSRLLVQDCAVKLEAFGLQGAIQEVSMIKVRAELELSLDYPMPDDVTSWIVVGIKVSAVSSARIIA